MRIEVIVDGESLDRHDFIVQPQRGDVIEFPAGELEVQELRHNFKLNRLQAWCSRRNPIPTDQPLGRQRSKKDEQ